MFDLPPLQGAPLWGRLPGLKPWAESYSHLRGKDHPKSAIPGTSYLATINLSLRDKSHSPIEMPRISRSDLLQMSKLQGTSCLATIVRSLRDKNHVPIEAPRIILALMGVANVG